MEKNIQAAIRCRITILLLALCWQIHPAAAQADISLLRHIQDNRSASSDKVMNIVTQSTYPMAAGICITQLVAGYIKHNRQAQLKAWQTTAGLGFTAIIAYGLKYTIRRDRPYQTYSDIIPYGNRDNDPSFPSGHTSFAFAAATSLSLEYRKWYVVAPAYLYAGMVGYSRLHLGQHYPTDVLAGALTGAGCAWLSYEGMKWLQHRKHRQQPAI